MRNDVVGRCEPLDDLKAARLLHQHALALTVRVADSDHKAMRHPPNELALVGRDRDKLPTGRIRTFAEEVHPSTVDPLEPPLVDLPAQGRGQRGLAFPILICSHNCSPPCVRRTINPANRHDPTRPHGRTWRRSSALLQRVRLSSTGNNGLNGLPHLPSDEFRHGGKSEPRPDEKGGGGWETWS